jgi:hypothetical protein
MTSEPDFIETQPLSRQKPTRNNSRTPFEGSTRTNFFAAPRNKSIVPTLQTELIG